ncbi:PAS domain-containing sensor histidine kinase [Flavisolibacter nicotianae]|uniref:PAS domain-containing sensor histidine kinase n=1 Tax=Flavisolibacter nicotianae TaxID=2364882 RepID=UPI000EAB4EED|nr:PAS domain-containing sensor histidine kinase [Flavisolibacter nicotianae]
MNATPNSNPAGNRTAGNEPLHSGKGRKSVEEHEELLRIALEGGDLGYYDYYPQTGELIWSARTKAMFGLPPEAEVDYNIYVKGLHPEDKQRSDAAVQKAMQPESGGLYENEYRTIGITDGKTRWIRSKGRLYFDEAGKAIRFSGITQDITERKNAEERLADSEKRYRQIFEGTPVSIWEKDFSKVVIELQRLKEKHGATLYSYLHQNRDEVHRLMSLVKIKDTNEASLKMFDAEKKEDLLKGLAVLFTPETLPVFTNELLAIANRQEDFESEYPLQTLKGRKIWCLVKTRLPQNDDYSRVLVSRFDITDRKKAEESLKESEAFNRTILENSPDCIKILNAEGRLQFINVNGQEHLELDDFAQVASKCWWELWDVKNEEKVKAAIQKAMNGEKAQFQGAALTAKGTLKWWDVVVSPVIEQNNSEKPKRLIAVSRDVTNQKQAEESIRRSEERFRGTFDNVAVGIAHVGLNGKWLMVNERLCQIVGYTKKELLSKTFQDITYPEDLETDLQLLQQLQEGTIETYSMEKRYFHKSGSLVWITLTVSLLRDGSGAPNYQIAVIQDITLRKQAEDALKESEDRFRALAETLEHVVDERTEALQRSNEDLQQFAHVASHDLKEPVRKIRTFSDRLHTEFEGILPERAKLYLSKIETSAERIYAMINGVLLYSSLDADDQVFEEVDLAKIIGEIATDLEVLISEKCAVLHRKQLPHVKGSPVLLYQLFYNLINNSLKFAKPSVAPEISIKAEEIGNKKYWKVIVEDNGIGFSQEEATHIFQTFTRLHAKDKYEGTGLGLALCKKIVERHSGSIEAEGIEGRGSKFTVTLPA